MRLAFLLCLLWIPLICSTETYDLARAWFKPHLVVNKNPAVCDQLLKGYTQYFLSSDTSSPLEADFPYGRTSDGAKITGSDLIELKWHQVPNQESEDFRFIEFEIGQESYVLMHEAYEGTLRETFLNKSINSIELKYPWHKHIDMRPITMLEPVEGEDGTYQIVHSPPASDMVSAAFTNIYRKGESVLMLLKTRHAQEFDLQSQRYGLYEMHPNQKIKLICELVSEPSNAEIKNVQTKIEYFQDFLNSLHNFMGEAGNCGSSNAHAYVINGIKKSLNDLAFRPWITSKNGIDQQPRYDTEFHLSRWQYWGIWNYKAYRNYQEARSKLSTQLANFYLANYLSDKNEAMHLADEAINHVIGVFNRVDYPPSHTTDKVLDAKKILLTSLAGADFQSNIQGLGIDLRELDSRKGFDGILTFALGHPDLLQYLIGQGMDVNKANQFGKTALMYAAQFNELASAKLLLGAGADVSAATKRPNDSCGYTLKNTEQTALHYAVRYASKDFIDLLLQNDALIYAQDSGQRTPHDYLVVYGGEDSSNKKHPESYGKKNRFLSAIDYEQLEERLRLAPESDRRRLAEQENLLGEEHYQAGRLQQAAASFKKAAMFDTTFFKAPANLTLTLLKQKEFGESARLATQLIGNREAPQDARAAAYFNLGLTCEQYKAANNSDYGIFHGSRSYCQEPSLNYFFRAFKVQPTNSRRDKILQIVNDTHSLNRNGVCQLDKHSILIFKDHHSYLFLTRDAQDVPFTGLSYIYDGKENQVEIIGKEKESPVGPYSIMRWNIKSRGISKHIRFEPSKEECVFLR